MPSSPTVFTYNNPIIDYLVTGIKFCSRCNESCTFAFKHRIISVDKQGNEISIFLTDNQIIQLTDLNDTSAIYYKIIDEITN